MYMCVIELTGVRFLANDVAPLRLPSCCGLEWLGSTPSIVYSTHSITCSLQNGTMLFADNLPNEVLCPCLPLHIADQSTLTVEECTNASNWRLFNSKCQFLSECPPSYRVVPLGGQAQGATIKCTGNGIDLLLMETECSGRCHLLFLCSPHAACGVPNCTRCPIAGISSCSHHPARRPSHLCLI